MLFPKASLFCEHMGETGDFTMLLRNGTRIFNTQQGLGLHVFA